MLSTTSRRRVAAATAALALLSAGVALALFLSGRAVNVRATSLTVEASAAVVDAVGSAVLSRALRVYARRIRVVPRPPRPPCVLRMTLLSDVLFDFGEWSLTRDGRKQVGQIADEIAGRRTVRLVRIEGHTDSVGGTLFNLGLSLERARTVRRELRRILGAAAPGMRHRAFGETRPKAANVRPDGSDYPAGRTKNRRVEVVLALC